MSNVKIILVRRVTCLMHMRIQILSSVGVGSMSNVKIILVQRVNAHADQGIFIRVGSMQTEKLSADKELMHMCVQEFSPVSGGWVHAKFKSYLRTKSSESRNCLQVWRGGMYKRKGNTRTKS